MPITKRVGSLIKVRPEYEERYIILHKHTFPGVLSQIRKVNIRNYSIFLLDGILFSYYQYIGNDFDNDMKAIADETTKEWWKLTDPMQEPLSTRKKGEWWAEMDLLSAVLETTSLIVTERHAYMANIKNGSEEKISSLLLEMEKLLIPYFKKFGLQNQNIFLKDNKLFVYLEYTGSNFSNDDLEFNKISEVSTFNKELGTHLLDEWREMKEVFHTE
jgi:L-rhamnose mutarotase